MLGAYAADISLLELTPDEYERFVCSPFVDEAIAGDDRVVLLAVHGDGPGTNEISSPGSLPVVVAWIGDRFGGHGPAGADLVIGFDDLTELHAVVARAPLASVALAVLLRAQPDLDVDAGLAAESAVYSLLQAGPEFAAWRAGSTFATTPDDDEVVSTEHVGDDLIITLDREHRHNAISTRLRDQLYASLALAVLDGSITHVHLSGRGPSFCSGGDLAEFGARPDVATSHAVRLARSPARLIHRLRDRITVHVHGATLGGGIEMAAFAGTVTAHPNTSIGLPELTLGLIPGAGGTVSLTRRIGRQRTAALALTTRRIDATTAHAWGLVDQVGGIVA